MFFFLEAAATTAAAGGGSMIIMLVAMFAIFYFMIIRPENKKKKKTEEMRNSLALGDEITTIGGIVGKIVQLTDDTINYHWEVPKTVGGDTFVITRQTPKDRQRAILYAPFFTKAKAEVFSEIFNPQYLEDGAKYETVNYWQAVNAGPAISVTPAITDMDTTSPTYGTQIAGANVAEDYILGVLYDEDALMIDYQFESANTTPLEARLP